MAELSDHQLMLAVKNGDLDRLGQLFERYHVRLYNLFLRQLGERQTSEDLVQEVFLRMLKYRHTYRGEGRFTTWMYTIARNVRADLLRRAARKNDFTHEIEELVSVAPDPAELSQRAGRYENLYRALGRLSDEKREVIELSRFQGLKYEEISEILGCPVGTIKARVFHAIRELRAYFDDRRDGARR